MRGHRHQLRVIGARLLSGPDVGEPIRDSEGRIKRSPSNPPDNVKSVEVWGFIGFPSKQEIEDGEMVDNAAHLPRGTVVARGDEIEAHDTGDANLDGRFQVTGVQSGRALVRVLLRRKTT